MWETGGVQVPMKIPAELDGPRGDVGNRSPPQSFPKVSLSLSSVAARVALCAIFVIKSFDYLSFSLGAA